MGRCLEITQECPLTLGLKKKKMAYVLSVAFPKPIIFSLARSTFCTYQPQQSPAHMDNNSSPFGIGSTPL